MQDRRQSRVNRIAASVRGAWADVNYAQRRFTELNSARGAHASRTQR